MITASALRTTLAVGFVLALFGAWTTTALEKAAHDIAHPMTEL